MTATAEVDATAPVTTSTIDAAWHPETQMVALTGSDTHSGVKTTFYRVNQGAVTTYTAPFAVSTAGTSAVDFYSIDNVGNRETTKTANVKIDNTAPVTSSDAASSYVGTATVHLTATDTNAGVAGTRFRTDNGSWTTGTVVTLTQLGSHTLDFYSVDAVGNVESTKTVMLGVYGRPRSDRDAGRSCTAGPEARSLTPAATEATSRAPAPRRPPG